MKPNVDHHGYIEWIEKLGLRYLPVEDRRTMKNEWRTSKNGWKLCEIPHGKRYGNVSEAPRLRFSSRKRFFQANSKEREVPKGLDPSFLLSSPIYSKIGEVVAAQLAQASSARPGEPGCFLQKQQPSGGIFWRAQVGLGAICTPIFT